MLRGLVQLARQLRRQTDIPTSPFSLIFERQGFTKYNSSVKTTTFLPMFTETPRYTSQNLLYAFYIRVPHFLMIIRTSVSSYYSSSDSRPEKIVLKIEQVLLVHIPTRVNGEYHKSANEQ